MAQKNLAWSKNQKSRNWEQRNRDTWATFMAAKKEPTSQLEIVNTAIPHNLLYSKVRLREEMRERIINQDDSIEKIIPYITMYGAGLHTFKRPVANFLLLGPTGVGKTRTIEALAEVIHGDVRHVLKINCGEYHADHEASKLIGAPPGYLGHRETSAALNQNKLNEVTSPHSTISLILFDEIEKAAHSIQRLLLGVMDKGTLALGDGTKVDFTRSIIFYTSNLGADKIAKLLTSGIGFSPVEKDTARIFGKIKSVGMAAVKKKFSPEFVNRLDEVLTYTPLDKESIRKIFNISVKNLKELLAKRGDGKEAVFLVMSKDVEDYLVDKGFSELYGARELNRTLQREIMNPLGDLLLDSSKELPLAPVIKAVLRDGQIVLTPIEVRRLDE